jgi:tRNA(Ile)-lysidine synthase
MALLEVLVSLGQRLAVAHVHHGLRGQDADADLELVRHRARSLGVAFFAEHVLAGRRDGRSPEARARALRYAALERVRAREGYRAVATAHTLDDQAETLLLRAVRGTSPAALRGIRAVHGSARLVRPLLGVRRSALRAYLESRGIQWREDATNADLRFPRNRIRLQVLALLEEAHPGATRSLARLAEVSCELFDWLDGEAERALGTARWESDWLRVDTEGLVALPAPLRAHALSLLLERAGLGEHVSRKHLRRVERLLLSAEPEGRLSLPKGRVMARSSGELRILDPSRARANVAPQRLEPPRALDLPGRSLRLEWRRREGPGAPCPQALVVPASLREELWLRSADARDRMRLAGESRPRDLSEIFRLARWSSEERRAAVVVACRGEVVWVVGLAASELCGAGRDGDWELRAVPVSSEGATC